MTRLSLSRGKYQLHAKRAVLARRTASIKRRFRLTFCWKPYMYLVYDESFFFVYFVPLKHVFAYFFRKKALYKFLTYVSLDPSVHRPATA